jgi:Cu(I)/Ag(I) efflux system membrane fusion protein
MVPANKFDKPGKSPFMDMMLVPVYADGDADQGKVTVSSRIQQNLGVRTAEVTEGTLSPQVSAVGSIAFNERDQVIVQARATGYVEHLYVRATLDPVAKGQPLAASMSRTGSLRRKSSWRCGACKARTWVAGRRRASACARSAWTMQIALVERSGKTSRASR